MDGIIASEGANVTSNSGGGSGGSVLIKTVQFSGHGILTVNGGSGNGNGGGGSGGRIAVHVAWLREYSGRYTAYGGLGSFRFQLTDLNVGTMNKSLIAWPVCNLTIP